MVVFMRVDPLKLCICEVVMSDNDDGRSRQGAISYGPEVSNRHPRINKKAGYIRGWGGLPPPDYAAGVITYVPMNPPHGFKGHKKKTT